MSLLYLVPILVASGVLALFGVLGATQTEVSWVRRNFGLLVFLLVASLCTWLLLVLLRVPA